MPIANERLRKENNSLSHGRRQGRGLVVPKRSIELPSMKDVYGIGLNDPAHDKRDCEMYIRYTDTELLGATLARFGVSSLPATPQLAAMPSNASRILSALIDPLAAVPLCVSRPPCGPAMPYKGIHLPSVARNMAEFSQFVHLPTSLFICPLI